MIVLRKQAYIIFFVLLFSSGVNLFAQEDVDFESLLQRVDTVENPVYLPLISIAYGPLYFKGDVRNASRVPLIGNAGIKARITTYIDNKHYISANFSFLTGALYGEQRSLDVPDLNTNFKSIITTFGASAHYEFGHFLPGDFNLRPFLSVGVEQLSFSTNGDFVSSEGERYYYWTDGSIRNKPESSPGGSLAINRDYVYETPLNINGISTRTFAFPIEVGFTLKIASRVFFSLGSEYHYTFTDYIDNVATEETAIAGDKAMDAFLFTSASLRFDLFSDPTTKVVDLMFADYDADFMFFEDEDGDMVLDNYDQCPGTPYGVVVDTTGCPIDRDEDGVADYLDKEPDTPKGNWVDDDGVSLSEEELLSRLNRESALKREDLDLYMELVKDKFRVKKVEDIPEKFAELDVDNDGYISFDELLKVIDGYFDYKVDLTLEELRQLNEYFFSQ